jgi:hypothetical protein
MARQRERDVGGHVAHDDAAARPRVEHGRASRRIAVLAHVIRAGRVERHQDDVGALARSAAARGRERERRERGQEPKKTGLDHAISPSSCVTRR